jgi:CO dehydrogenase/acetyl-CoA synthase gamma subunit (corrinoid Fe-S protein)
MQYTYNDLAAYLARRFSQSLRFNTDGFVWEESVYGGPFQPVDLVRVMHYAQTAINELLSHAMSYGPDAIASIHALVPDEAGWNQVISGAQKLLTYPEQTTEEQEEETAHE